ncbi:hypothetical protein GCM10028807_62450 [Spirosoma daeguense]
MAIVAGTKPETVIEVLRKLPENQRKKVQEITLDMAGNMGLIAKKCFPKATQVTDRFHVQQLALEAVQTMRVEYRWQLYTPKMRLSSRLNSQTGFMRRTYFVMAIHLNNCWLAVAMCFIKKAH